MQKKVQLIQRKILFKLFKNSIKSIYCVINDLNKATEKNKYINLFDQEKDLEERYEKTQNILISSKNIKIIDIFINKLIRYIDFDLKLNSRKFMIAWLISGFPKYMLNNLIDEYPTNIYNASCSFINKIKILLDDINDKNINIFIREIISYTKYINYFIERDKIEQINKMFDEYIGCCDTIELVKSSEKYSDEQKESVINLICNSKNDIFLCIKMINSSITKEYLEFCYDISKNIRENNKKIIYDVLLDDINNKKYILFRNIVENIKDYLIKLENQRMKICANINEILDVDFIIAHLSLELLTKDNVCNYGNYLINLILQFDSPINDTVTRNKWMTMKYEEYENNNIFLVDMLLFIIEKIIDINETLNNLFNLIGE